MSCPFAGNIAPGVELMGMPMPTLIKSTLKTIESGCHNSMFWELIPLLYNSVAKVISSIYRFFSAVKIENFIKMFDIFHIFDQNIDCGYPPRRFSRVPTIYVLDQK